MRAAALAVGAAAGALVAKCVSVFLRKRKERERELFFSSIDRCFFLNLDPFPPPPLFFSFNLFRNKQKKQKNRGLDRAKASPAARAASNSAKGLPKADAELAAALASHDATRHLVAGWPAAGERDELKAALLSAVRARIAAPGKESEGEIQDGEKLESLRQSILVAPAAEKRPKQLENISDSSKPPRVDDYYWLRDDARKNKDVLAHLAAENAYVAASLADTSAVCEKITKELRAAIQEADEGAPVRKSGYWWWWRTKEGGEYKQHVRRKVSKGALARQCTERDAAELVEANAARAAGVATSAAAGGGGGNDADAEEEEKEEIFLDEDLRAKGKAFYMTGGVTASPDGSALAWGEDTEGGEKYTLHCVDLRTGEPLLKKPIPSTAGNFVFSSPPPKGKKKDGGADSSSSSSSNPSSNPSSCSSTHLFYTTKDALDRPNKVWRHKLGSDSSEDACIYHEEDDGFYISVGRARDGSLILISSGSAITTEVRALKADEPESELVVLLPRIHDVEYDVGCHSAAGRVSLFDAKTQHTAFGIRPVQNGKKSISRRERTREKKEKTHLFFPSSLSLSLSPSPSPSPPLSLSPSPSPSPSLSLSPPLSLSLSLCPPSILYPLTAPRRPKDRRRPKLRASRPCARHLEAALGTSAAQPRDRSRPRRAPPRCQARGFCRLFHVRGPLRARRGPAESDDIRPGPRPERGSFVRTFDGRQGRRL